MFLHHGIIANDTLYLVDILKECKFAAFDVFRQMYSVPFIGTVIKSLELR